MYQTNPAVFYLRICRKFIWLNSERSATLKKRNGTTTKQKGLPTITKICCLGKLMVPHAATVEKQRWAECIFTSNKVHYTLCPELNDSPETMSNWMETSLIREKNQLRFAWLPVTSNQPKLLTLQKAQIGGILVEQKDFSNQLPMLRSSTAGRQGCQNIKQLQSYLNMFYSKKWAIYILFN